MTTTANLTVTKIDVGQEQKEVTANEAFDVFDAALSELAHVMTDADYTLLTTTVPQEWQYGILSFSGTLTAARNVIAPLNRKEYTVVNGTTGGFALTFKTAAGTGIAVAAGASAILRCDGTNIVAVTASDSVAAHVAAADPHTQYVLTTDAQPFDVHAFHPGIPAASAKVLRVPVARAVAFVANFAGSYGKASAAATASTAFDVQKNGASIGTITFAAAASSATFATAAGAAQSLAAGDVLAIIAPATPDLSLSDVGFVLSGTR